MLPQVSTQQVLMMVAANLLPLALVFSAIVLIIWARRRHAVKRAGVKADSPGCTRCLYLVRGWNSPMCPECGADVRTAGVCIGPRVHLALKLIGAVTMAACLAILLGSLIGMWLLTSQRTMAAWHMKDAGGAYQLDLRTYNERIRLPRRDDHFTTITIDPANSFGGLVIGFDGFSWRDVEPAPGLSRESWRRISIGPGDPLPSPQEIADTIMQAVAPKAAPLAHAQAAWLHQQIVAMRSVPPNAVGVTAPTNLYTFSGSGSGSGTGFSRYGNTLLVALLIASLLITPVVVWRTHRPGWRPVVEGEWERTGGTPPAAAQQLAT